MRASIARAARRRRQCSFSDAYAAYTDWFAIRLSYKKKKEQIS
jgi:hypothetical protein